MIRSLIYLTSLSAGLLLSIAAVMPDPVLALQFNSSNVGAPGNREAGSARSSPCVTTDRGLVALIPADNVGLTTAAYPTVFAYLPPSTARVAEFALLDEQTNEEVYRATLDLPEQPGIFTVAVPNDGSVAALEVGRKYYWFFTVICNPNNRAEDMLVQGNIERVVLSPEVQARIATSDPAGQPAIYAEAGIWQDTLVTLHTLWQANPDDAVIRQEWASLLESVGLEAIATEPIL